MASRFGGDGGGHANFGHVRDGECGGDGGWLNQRAGNGYGRDGRRGHQIVDALPRPFPGER